MVALGRRGDRDLSAARSWFCISADGLSGFAGFAGNKALDQTRAWSSDVNSGAVGAACGSRVRVPPRQMRIPCRRLYLGVPEELADHRQALARRHDGHYPPPDVTGGRYTRAFAGAHLKRLLASLALAIVLALKIWLEEQLARVSAKSVIAEAIRYGLNHWDGLVRFLEDGRIELGRVDDWRGGCRRRGLTVSGGFRPRRCRSSLHGSVSSRRSSNRACRFPAPGFLSFHQAFALGRSSRLLGMRKSPSVSCR